MRNRHGWMSFLFVAAAALLATGAGAAASDPTLPAADAETTRTIELINSGFEQDRFFTYPGYASAGRPITGWKHTVGAGINPYYVRAGGAETPQSPFHDNGRIPEGKQIALLQNDATLSQPVALRAGRSYIVLYREAARDNQRPAHNPRLAVYLGGELIVSEHAIEPVDDRGRFVNPFNRVRSAPHRAQGDGEQLLEFRASGTAVTVLIDDVRVLELPRQHSAAKAWAAFD